MDKDDIIEARDKVNEVISLTTNNTYETYLHKHLTSVYYELQRQIKGGK